MSRESIIKDLPEDYVRRMRNWVRADSGQGQYAMTSAYTGERERGDVYDSHMPVLEGEARDTATALDLVPNRERQAVMLFWQYEGRSLESLGKRLSPEAPLHYETVERRVREGHRLHLAEIRRMTAEHYRQREAMQQGYVSASAY
jgi:hypothetical protein